MAVQKQPLTITRNGCFLLLGSSLGSDCDLFDEPRQYGSACATLVLGFTELAEELPFGGTSFHLGSFSFQVTTATDKVELIEVQHIRHNSAGVLAELLADFLGLVRKMSHIRTTNIANIVTTAQDIESDHMNAEVITDQTRQQRCDNRARCREVVWLFNTKLQLCLFIDKNILIQLFNMSRDWRDWDR